MLFYAGPWQGQYVALPENRGKIVQWHRNLPENPFQQEIQTTAPFSSFLNKINSTQKQTLRMPYFLHSNITRTMFVPARERKVVCNVALALLTNILKEFLSLHATVFTRHMQHQHLKIMQS